MKSATYILCLTTSAIIVLLGIAIITTTYAQPQGWLTHTSNNCKLTIDYPSTWTIKEKQGRFDVSTAELQLSAINPGKGNIPFLTFTQCLKYDSPSDMDTLSVYTNTLQDGMLNSRSTMQIVDYSHLEKNFIGGKDAGVFAVMDKQNDIPGIGMELYNVINCTMLYQFAYTDLVDHFDSVEGKQIRDHILKSIKFLP